MNAHKERVAQAFSRSAQTYDQAAQVQDDIAAEVAAKALNTTRSGPLPDDPKILEVGCGTGALTRRMLDGVDGGTFLVTDIAPDMLGRCQANISDPRVSFVCMDGEHPAPVLGDQCFDLIVTSLAVQWFVDLRAGLVRLSQHLNPGGRIVFSTLGDGTFIEWRAAHTALGLADGIPAFINAGALTRMWPQKGKGIVSEKMIKRRYQNARSFARILKSIGANTPAIGHKPLSPKNFRRLSAHLGPNFANTYHVVYGDFTKT